MNDDLNAESNCNNGAEGWWVNPEWQQQSYDDGAGAFLYISGVSVGEVFREPHGFTAFHYMHGSTKGYTTLDAAKRALIDAVRGL